MSEEKRGLVEQLQKRINEIIQEEREQKHYVEKHPYETIETIRLQVINEALVEVVGDYQKQIQKRRNCLESMANNEHVAGKDYHFCSDSRKCDIEALDWVLELLEGNKK